jgi:hypothetical protein
MNIAGNFDYFADTFPTALLPRVFDMICNEWPKSPRPDDNPIENRITNRFVGHLIRVMRKETSPAFRFTYRPKLASADSDSETGEVDIRIDSFSCRQEAYFVFECKRLNINGKSGLATGASAYVGKEGMGCFISGKYPTTCGCGGMLGYVMDQNVDSAIASINTALSGHKDQLQLCCPHLLQTAAIHPDVWQTLHGKEVPVLTLYHLLLPF